MTKYVMTYASSMSATFIWSSRKIGSGLQNILLK